MEISNLLAHKRTIQVEFAGNTVKVTYDPAKVTQRNNNAWADKADEVRGDTDKLLEVLDEQFIEMVVGWDLTEGGDPYPITKESVWGLPRPFINAIRTAIFSDEGEMSKKDKRMTSMTG